MKFFKRFLSIFSVKKPEHPRMSSFDLLTKEERFDLLRFEAKEFSKRYGSVIKALAKE